MQYQENVRQAASAAGGSPLQAAPARARCLRPPTRLPQVRIALILAPEPIRQPDHDAAFGWLGWLDWFGLHLLGLLFFSLHQLQCLPHAHRNDAVGGEKPSPFERFMPVRVAPVRGQGVLGLEPLRLFFDAEVALDLVLALEGFAVFGQGTAEFVQAGCDAWDELLDQRPVAHAVGAGLKEHLAMDFFLVR